MCLSRVQVYLLHRDVALINIKKLSDSVDITCMRARTNGHSYIRDEGPTEFSLRTYSIRISLQKLTDLAFLQMPHSSNSLDDFRAISLNREHGSAFFFAEFRGRLVGQLGVLAQSCSNDLPASLASV